MGKVELNRKKAMSSFLSATAQFSDVWKRRNTVSLKSDFLTLYRVRKRHLQHEEIPSILVKTEPVENFNT